MYHYSMRGFFLLPRSLPANTILSHDLCHCFSIFSGGSLVHAADGPAFWKGFLNLRTKATGPVAVTIEKLAG